MQPRQSLLVLGNAIGSGGFGTVYEARWGNQPCAAKIPYVHNERQIQREIMFLQNLRHRNIIQFYRTLEEDDQIYILMELAENGSLFRAIRRGLLTWKDKTRIAHEIARGLEYIHRENILHRNLKSPNVLLTRHMEVKLGDFGNVQIQSTESSSLSDSSEEGGIVGTLRWMAPEIFDSIPRYSTKSDVYALGMVMWEMAANCTEPFNDQRDTATIMSIVKSGLREVLPDHTPTEYRQWVERCWHQDPDQRPDASEIVLLRVVSEEISANSTSLITLSIPSDDNDDSNDSDDSITISDTEGELGASVAAGRLPRTDDDVVQYFCRAAREGNSDAQLFLAWLYRHGGGIIDKNDKNSLWWYRKSAKRGNTVAQFAMGEAYEQGLDVDANIVKAAKWYRKAADHGVAKAQIKLGKMYEDGCGVRQNNVEAARWYQKAAEQGYDDAQVTIGAWYSLGRGVEQSDSIAAKWFVRAAEQGNTAAQYNLAVMYERGQGVEQSDDKAVKWFTKAAEQGNASAQAGIAVMYRRGQGVERNDVMAAEWFTKAADRGDTSAQTSLGWMYEQGIGVEQSDVEATRWFTKAAEKGYTAALFNLGMMYVHGRGVEQSDVEAVKLFTKAAEQGYAPALFSLGVMYEQGRGAEQSDVEAVKLFTKAAEQGHEDAQTSLGWMYKHGKGVEQCDVEAIIWFRKAADQGYAPALFNLGMMYEQGRGVEQSNIEAIKLFTKAAEQGHEDAQTSLGWMYKQDGVEQSDVEAVRYLSKVAEQGQTSLSPDHACSFGTPSCSPSPPHSCNFRLFRTIPPHHLMSLQVTATSQREQPSSKRSISFTLGRQIGKGGFGCVFFARWQNMTVAAKAFNFSRSELSKGSIKKEISILQGLHHPNIIQFYDTHTHDDGSVFLIMDLAKKGSLRQAIKNTELVNWDTKTRIAHEIARGLEYIHSKRVIHRDLKSANVLLTEHMTVKLADFGLSEIKIATTRSTGTFTGTIGWMAPELFVPRPKYSTKSDMYAFGMVMWEMAAMNTTPFRHHCSRGVLAALVERGLREELPEETPDEYRALVTRCWDSDPEKRPEAIEVKLIDDRDEIDNRENDSLHSSEPLSFQWTKE